MERLAIFTAAATIMTATTTTTTLSVNIWVGGFGICGKLMHSFFNFVRD
jgi:hypothetical protein